MIWKREEFLVYIQRKELSKFDFDPSNKQLWEDHNRPWDYDHIVPTDALNGQKHKETTYLHLCKQFQQSIGNQMALDFSTNRSKSNDRPDLDDPKYELPFYFGQNKGSFDKDVFKNFGGEDAKHFEKSQKFMIAVVNRLSTLRRCAASPRPQLAGRFLKFSVCWHRRPRR